MKSDICISIVSHGHGDLIKRLGVIERLAKKFKVIVKINEYEPNLTRYLSLRDIDYIEEDKGLGFGANNNQVFEFYLKTRGHIKSSFFITLNPDVDIEEEVVDNLISNMRKNKVKLASLTLYKDRAMTCLDSSVRSFPNLQHFVTSFLGLSKSTVVNSSSISKPTQVDWAAGSFLAFDSEHYASLKGFDEGYFMYCEDIDVCYRSSLIGHSLTYYPDFKAIHYAARTNRRIFSKHFRWHLKSVLRYLLRKYCMLNDVNSRLNNDSKF